MEKNKKKSTSKIRAQNDNHLLEEKTIFLKQQLEFIFKKLSESDIDFYLVGAVGAFVHAKLEFIRVHDDIDILICENDIDKLKELFINTDYTFIDNRLTTTSILNEYGFPEGVNHDLYALYKDNMFHIGFFTYKKSNETISFVDYFNENGEVKKLIRSIPKEMFYYQYDDNKVPFLNYKIKCVRKELIYKNKLVMNREKDLIDCKILKPYLDEFVMANLSTIKNFRTVKVESVVK